MNKESKSSLKHAKFTSVELAAMKEMADKTYFKSHFNFLRMHNGLRPGAVHTLLGTAGGGKTTLVRSLIINLVDNMDEDERGLLWLSEELVTDFVTELSRSGYVSSKLENLKVFSETDDGSQIRSPVDVIRTMRQTIKENEISYLIIDNITTSKLYMDMPVKVQSDMALEVKKIATEFNIPILIVAHCGAQVNDNLHRLVDMNDIRGSKALVNLSQFFYIMQRFVISETIYPTIRVTKHRGQEMEHSMFFLRYLKERRIYIEDKKISFSDFKEAFKKRNVL